MSFTAIFIALLIERFFDCSHLRYWGWYQRYQHFFIRKFSKFSPYVLLIGMIAPLIIAVILIELLIGEALFGFLKLGFSILFILYCFGPRNLWADMFVCLSAISKGDPTEVAEKLKSTFGMSDNEPKVMHRQWFNAVFIEAHRRVFALIFWFGFFGLSGVFFYRLISLASKPISDTVETAVTSPARRVESYLDWPSIRSLTLIFALGGNFGRVLSCWRTKAMQGPEANEPLLIECGVAALNNVTPDNIPLDGSIEKEEISLLDRSFGIVLVIIAVLVFLIP